ncbi:hypothetical protein COOONC_13233 [Cooperia oncophora]
MNLPRTSCNLLFSVQRIVYSGVTFALSSILLTGQNDAFTLSLNARCKDFRMSTVTRFIGPLVIILQILVHILMQILAHTSLMSSWSSSPDFAHLLDFCCERFVFSSKKDWIPRELSLANSRILFRDRMRAADVRTLSDDRWFLVETNFDPWKKPGDKRRFVY